jgi:hypothetical protein
MHPPRGKVLGQLCEIQVRAFFQSVVPSISSIISFPLQLQNSTPQSCPSKTKIMRLINASSLQLEAFNDSSTPPYAVLSHTWGDSEITYAELHSSTTSLFTARTLAQIKSKPRYYKITKCCSQALQDGLQYVWVDTCCIDKSSSAELSEAINSMYRWYKNAVVCYVYLDDIDVFDPMRGGSISFARAEPNRFWTTSIDSISENDLSKARWFTRGWTLQELIAPEKVEFYIKGWNYVGSKVNMREKLARITGIDRFTLIYGNLESVSIARRMSWAAKRVTTRTEDLAYCLLGIFDVNMPLLYGEGEKAFVRLQEEIMKDSEDQSLFAWSPPVPSEACDLDRVVAMGVGEGRSVFARHPTEYAHSSEVHPSSSRSRAPYTLTNKGVRMEAPILPMKDGLFLLILEVSYIGEASHQLGIFVQKPEGGSINQFVRHDALGLIKVSHDMVQSAKLNTVFLCKKVPYTVPQITLN